MIREEILGRLSEKRLALAESEKRLALADLEFVASEFKPLRPFKWLMVALVFFGMVMLDDLPDKAAIKEAVEHIQQLKAAIKEAGDD